MRARMKEAQSSSMSGSKLMVKTCVLYIFYCRICVDSQMYQTEDDIPNDFEGRERVEAQVVPPPVTVSPSGSGEESAQSLPATSPSVEDTSISARNFQTVSSFLAKKGNEPLNRVELAGLVHLLQGSVVGKFRQGMLFIDQYSLMNLKMRNPPSLSAFHLPHEQLHQPSPSSLQAPLPQLSPEWNLQRSPRRPSPKIRTESIDGKVVEAPGPETVISHLPLVNPDQCHLA